MDRRLFIKSLVGVTAGLQVSRAVGNDGNDTEVGRDRLGKLLPRRRLRGTDEAVTMLGVGGWHIGRMNEREAEETIEAALEGGVRFFDSAEMYQNGRSEERLGRLLVPKYRDELFLMTKTTARDAATARRHLEESLRRLKTDQIDLWQIHAIESDEDVDKRLENGVLEVLLEAQSQGKVRHIGFTGHRTPEAHDRMLEKGHRFQACQMPINVADISYNSFIKKILPRLAEQNISALAMKTLANGGFFGGSEQGEHGDNPRVVPNKLSIEEALHFAWSLPVSTVISGPDNADQMREKIRLARSFEGMNESDREKLIERVADMAGRQVEFYKA